MSASSTRRGRGRAEPRPEAGPPSPTLAALVRGLAPGTSWQEARRLCQAGRVWVEGRPVGDAASRPAAGGRIELLSAAVARARLAALAGGEGRRARAGGEDERGGEREGDREGEGEGKGKGEGDSGGAGSEFAPSAPLVVYADADVVVVRKPAGVLTVPFERGDRDTLLALTRVALRRLDVQMARGAGTAGAARTSAAAANPTLRAVQRLDKDTSGLVVFARGVAAQRCLQQQLARREVMRRYQALAHGAAGDATYDSWLVEDRGDGLRGSWGRGPAAEAGKGAGRGKPARRPPRPPEPSQGAARSAPPAGARHAVTEVRAVEALPGATLLACELATGRQHQIRIHLAEAGHPLLGETVYVRDYRGPRIPAPRPMLHAGVLGFRHPRDGRPLLFEEPPPPDFAAVLRRLRRLRRATGGVRRRNLPGRRGVERAEPAPIAARAKAEEEPE
jgi:23S rRNA pseudouridine1911/1915/1917 synthase